MSEILVSNVAVNAKTLQLSAWTNPTDYNQVFPIDPASPPSTYSKNAQQFTTTEAFDLTAINMALRSSGSVTGDVGFAIDIVADNSGLPDTTILGTSERIKFINVPYQGTPPSGAPYLNSNVLTLFTFSTPIALTAATKYWIIYRYDNVGTVVTDENNQAVPMATATVGDQSTDPTVFWDPSGGGSWDTSIAGSLPDFGMAYQLFSSQLLNITTGPLVLFVAADDPITLIKGALYYNSTTDKLKFCDGSAWHTVTST